MTSYITLDSNIFGTLKLLSILFQDDDIVVVHKPANMLVHKSMIDRHETEFLMKILRDQIGQYVYPVHRLDKPTSGVILFALSSEIARELAQQFEAHTIQKEYHAVVRGFAPESAFIDYALKEKLDPIADKKANKNKEAQEAHTEMVKLAELALPIPVGRYPGARFSLVKLFPKTGRKHQLRRHMAHIRHPIIGDTTHGDGKQNRFARDVLHFNKLALCATKLSFIHPTSAQPIVCETVFEDDFQALVDRFAIA
jgi:tRNA pseudouridine65 synthase